MLSSLPLLSQSPDPPHLMLALSYVGEKEVTNNSSPVIDKWLAYVRLNPGYAYCAANVSYCIGVSGVSYPKVRSARAQSFILPGSISAAKMLRDNITIPKGSIVVWKDGNTAFGHVGFVREDWQGADGKTVEANTSGNNRGSQREGEGVHLKDRRIIITAAFRITHFTLVSYE